MTSDGQSEIWANWNGTECRLDEVRIPLGDRAYYFGDAAYEALRVYGGKPWLWAEHLARFERTLHGLRITTDLSRFADRVLKTLARSGVRDGLIYAEISRGGSRRTHAFPKPPPPPNELVYVEPWSQDPLLPYRETGIAVMVTEDLRWQRRDLKTVNLLANCLAKQEALEAGCQEAILVEADGRVTEATSSNVFVVDRGRVLTAPVSHKILAGVTRGFVVSLAKGLGMPVEERFFTRDTLPAAEEIFLTGTSNEVLSVTRLDGKPVGDGKPGPIARRLWAAYREAVVRFIERPA